MTVKIVILFKGWSEDYDRCFRERGYEPKFIESLQFTYINLSKLHQSLEEGVLYDGIILTSPRSIEATKSCLNGASIPTVWKTKKVYAVGEASGARIKDLLDLDARGVNSGNANTLGDIIINESKAKSRYLFPCGNLRSETLVDKLRNVDIQVEPLTVYETEENVNLQEKLRELSEESKRPTALVFFSPSGCEFVYKNLVSLNSDLYSIPCFAIGNSTSQKLENLGIHAAGVSQKPKAECVADTVIQYFEKLSC